VTAQFMQHSNQERAHQGRSCGHRPPRIAHPVLPPLPSLPKQVDPDGWLASVDGQAFAWKVDGHGCVRVDLQTYSSNQQLSGRQVVLVVNAQSRTFAVFLGNHLIKQVPSKGWRGQILP